MGYTHYFYLPAEIDPRTFADIATDALKVAEASGVPLAGEWDDAAGGPAGEPLFGVYDLILFNGRGDEGHETFYFSRRWFPKALGREPFTDDDGRIFHFCKTAYKPYDVVVTAVLIVVKHHLGDAARVSSDGNDGEWAAGKELAQSVLGYGLDYAIQGEGEERGLFPVEAVV